MDSEACQAALSKSWGDARFSGVFLLWPPGYVLGTDLRRQDFTDRDSILGNPQPHLSIVKRESGFMLCLMFETAVTYKQ